MKPREIVVNRREMKWFRKRLRANMTPAEAILWKQIKAAKLKGTKWRRQFSVGNYILDFYCPQCKLCIELDGSEHYTMHGDTYDCVRSEYLISKGITILRFENKEIYDNIDKVLDVITAHLHPQ